MDEMQVRRESLPVSRRVSQRWRTIYNALLRNLHKVTTYFLFCSG
jgi:hypothetical protein